VLPSAFGLLNDQFAILEIPQSELQHFSDPHTASCHQFQYEPITGFGGSENDIVHSLLFDDFPFRSHALPVKLADHRRVAWIYKVEIQIVADEIEEGTNVGITDAFDAGLVSFGESVQEPQNIIG